MALTVSAQRAFVAVPAQKARLPARRTTVRVAAVADEKAFECPLVECAAVNAKTSCVHPGRPVAQACADCPRRGKAPAPKMAKTKCVHPNRTSGFCADCPRNKK